MNDEIEQRSFNIAEFVIDQAEDDSPKMRGHAAVFNLLSEDLGGFKEKIAPGAFKETLKNADIRALFNHDPNFVLARNKSGTLRLSEDDTGLNIEIDPPDTQVSRDLQVSMKRGDISQMSFGFRTLQDSWEKIEGELVRTLLEVELRDVSPVTYPAYVQTDVAVRSMDKAFEKEAMPDTHLIDLQRKRLDLLE